MSFTRRLASGTTQLTLSNSIVRLLSIVTMPILTTLLTPQDYGVAALVGTAISLVSVVALAGIDMSYSRAYHSAQPPSGTAVEHFCWRFAILVALPTSVIAAAVWWIISRDSVEFERGLAILLALGIVASVGNTMVNTRARLAGRYRAMALVIVASGIIGAATSIAIAVWWRQDAIALLLPMIIGYLLPILLLGAPSMATLVKRSVLARGEGMALIKIGLAGVVTAPMYWLLSSSDRWFLQHYHGAESVGVYSIGYSVAIVGMMVNNALMSVWLPEAAREYEQDRERARTTLGRLMSRLIAAMAIIWLIATAAGGDIVRWLANARFHAAAEVVPYVAGGVFFYGVLHLANTGLLLAKKLKWAALWWLAGGLVCILLNLTLVSQLGGIGAAITQSISFAFISIGILASSQAIFRVHLDWIRLALALTVVAAAGTVMAPSWNETAQLSLLSKIPVVFAVAAVVAWLVAADWCAMGVQYLRGPRSS